MRDIKRHIAEIYNVEISTDLVTRVTDEVLTELEEWRSRPLEEVYPIVYLDALVVKIRSQGTVKNLGVCLALGEQVQLGARDRRGKVLAQSPL